MRILVTGTTGFIGGRIAAHLRHAGHSVLGTHRSAADTDSDTPLVRSDTTESVRLDLADPSHIDELLRTERFDAIVHAAAMAGLGQCERNPASALLANSAATAIIAQGCCHAGIRLIALSTDQVFSGGPPAAGAAAPPGGYREDNATAPVNHYGLTKQHAEASILNRDAPQTTVVRLALVVGRSLQSGRSSSEQLITQVMRGETPTLYRDEFRTPICVADVCSAIEDLLPMSNVKLLHLGGPERMSRVELGRRILQLAGLNDACRAVNVAESGPTEAKRPRDVTLDSSLAREILKRPPRRLEDWPNEFTP
jgi:dTDP-4-dehydrorhamnose reductase